MNSGEFCTSAWRKAYRKADNYHIARIWTGTRWYSSPGICPADCYCHHSCRTGDRHIELWFSSVRWSVVKLIVLFVIFFVLENWWKYTFPSWGQKWMKNTSMASLIFLFTNSALCEATFWNSQCFCSLDTLKISWSVRLKLSELFYEVLLMCSGYANSHVQFVLVN